MKIQSAQNCIHKPLKRPGGIAHAEGKHCEPEGTSPGYERTLVSILLIKGYLVVPAP